MDEFIAGFEYEVLDDLKYVYQTKNDVICLTSSGTGGMEAPSAATFTAFALP